MGGSKGGGGLRRLTQRWTEDYRDVHFAIVLVSVATIALLLPPLLKTSFKIFLDYNEGWNAVIAVRAMRGENIYDYLDAFIINNYPPISFYIVGLLGKAFGDNIFAGRFVALLSFIIVGINISITTWTISKDKLVSLFSGLFFIAMMGANYPLYIAMNDPQMLAHAIMTTALVVFLRGWDQRRGLLLVAVLVCAAGFTKHNLVSLPLALTVFILLEDRAFFLKWLIYCTVVLSIAIFAFVGIYGSTFVENILDPRIFDFHKLFRRAPKHLMGLQIPLVFLGVLAAFGIRYRYFLLINLYVLFSLATGLFFVGGDVDTNAFFDLVIALAIGSGVGLAHVYGSLTRTRIANRDVFWVLPVLLSLGVFLSVPGKLQRPDKLWSRLETQQASTARDVGYLATQKGAAFCERIALCYWAGKEFEYDPYNMQQAFLKGRRDENEILEKLNDRYFSVIQINQRHGQLSRLRFSDQFISFLETHYEIDRTSINGAFLIPKN